MHTFATHFYMVLFWLVGRLYAFVLDYIRVRLRDRSYPVLCYVCTSWFFPSKSTPKTISMLRLASAATYPSFTLP
jgi:hypothetical protein